MNTLTSFVSIDEIFSETARAVFDQLKPEILLVGEEDDHLKSISSLYKWAAHSTSVPSQLSQSLALVVTNSSLNFNRLINIVSKDTALLVYDESCPISVEDREKRKGTLTCYLHSVSPRFIKGHVRTLLQLRKSYLGVNDQNVPLMISGDAELSLIKAVICELDDGENIFIRSKHLDHTFSLFSMMSKLTRYEDMAFVHAEHANDKKYQHNHCLMIAVSDEKQIIELEEVTRNKAIIWISDKDIKTKYRKVDVSNVGVSNKDYYLMSYFHSLQSNLMSKQNLTRFIQVGDVDKLIAAYQDPIEISNQMTALFDRDDIKFRNIPPSIKNLRYGNRALYNLLSDFDRKIFAEIFSQCNDNLEHAELLTGIRRSTLQDKQKN